MSLTQWADNGWLKTHQTSLKEIQDLLAIVKRDLADAGSRHLRGLAFRDRLQRRAEVMHDPAVCLWLVT